MLDNDQIILFKKVLGNAWYIALEKTLNTKEFSNLAKFINYERTKYTIYPENMETIFRAFTLTSLSDILVIILGQTPYHNGRYDGLAFSNGGQKHPSPSLLNILVEVETQIYQNHKDLLSEPYFDLSRWAKQGVLLLNTALTVRKGEPESHIEQWEFFTAEVMKALGRHHSGLIYMLWGKHAKSYIKFIDRDRNYILTCGHPVTKHYGNDLWSNNGHFAEANRILKSINNRRIKW